ncbi:MAG: polysaccharide biosynthesis protein, partial [Clostridiales bacterium]|nr:polysaccharide biosynthesis protein [Candidatus Apopatousia equi]
MKDSKSKFLYGALVLTITSVIAKGIGAFFRVPLINMIGSNGLGIFQLIFPIYSFFLIFITGGISTGLCKLIIIERQDGNAYNEKKLLKSCLLMMLCFSFILSLLFLILSFPLSIFQGNKQFYICYFALIPALIFSSLICAFRGYFQGHENMLPSGISQIIEQGVKLCISLFLAKILIKKGVIFAVFGVFLGISVSELSAFVYLAVKYFIEKSKSKKEVIEQKNHKEYSYKECFVKIIKMSFPIMLNGAILPLVCAIESMICIFLLGKANIGSTTATSLFGLEDGIVSSLINLPTVFAVAISTALIPSLSSDYNKNDILSCERKCKSALKLTWLISLPCGIAFLFFSKEIILFLYQNGLNTTNFDELKVAVDLLKISSLNIVYISLLSITTSILQAINKSYVPVKNLFFSSCIKLGLTLLLVSSQKFNVYGIVISDIVGYSLALI